MSRTTIAISKFVGSISLGLLTGISYSLATLTVPSLLALPSATTAHHTFTRLRALAITHLRALSLVSGTSLVLAYWLSPRRARHPYLLWTSLTVALGAAGDLWSARQQRLRAVRRGRGDEEFDGSGAGTGRDAPVNGEEVRNAMEGFQVGQMAWAGVSGLGFVMSVVGIWGDVF
ncbi:MAG: hypothetical protein M1817_000931 [Caeruleum heppii]|nr:MAG: hypothetical protein M1817_000931 [Caeruleum heppii]